MKLWYPLYPWYVINLQGLRNLLRQLYNYSACHIYKNYKSHILVDVFALNKLTPSDSYSAMLGCVSGMEVKPCNGATPLVSPETGAEYDCGSGPRRQDCPSGSYCHQTPHFAKCCRKGTPTGVFHCLHDIGVTIPINECFQMRSLILRAVKTLGLAVARMAKLLLKALITPAVLHFATAIS